MRYFVLVAIWLLLSASAQAADVTGPFRASAVRLTASTDPPLEVLIWYPTSTPASGWQLGSFDLHASHRSPIAAGRYPIILLSHGGGPTGGSPVVLSDFAAGLARSGFIVVAPFHKGQSHNLSTRPAQMIEASRLVSSSSLFKGHLLTERVGLVGYSLGGAVALILAGAKPDDNYFAAYCSDHPSDVMSCTKSPQGSPRRSPEQRHQMPHSAHLQLPSIPFKPSVLVLLDPLVAPFPPAAVSELSIPILLLRPTDSALQPDANVDTLVRAKLHDFTIQEIPGNHFIFTDICPGAVVETAGELCKGVPGIDRSDIHSQIISIVTEFMRKHL